MLPLQHELINWYGWLESDQRSFRPKRNDLPLAYTRIYKTEHYLFFHQI